MEQDWKDKFRAEILEDMKKEAKQEIMEDFSRVYIETTDYCDEQIFERTGVPLYKIERFREDYKRWEFVKKLEITEEPQYVEDEHPSQCLHTEMYVKRGKMNGTENMLLFGLYATGLKRFLEIISDETKETLRKMLNEQYLDIKEEDED
ncbi:hypothetical protein [Cytobacillus praedii]|uniref:hypothetical protein n=1 Tax=Cytobacillus praedii TaxID=1742358 RepID=UPI002E20A007|nr:hypothetical protein [Cytobacillus praedii]